MSSQKYNDVGDVRNRLADIERRLRTQESAPRASATGIDRGGIILRDEGAITASDSETSELIRIGRQADGTYAALSLGGPAPDQPSDPIVTPIVGGLQIDWDGQWKNELVAPLDFSRIEVHLSQDAEFIPEASTLIGTIETPQGANVQRSLVQGEYYVRFVARTLSGKASLPSERAGGSPIPISILDTDINLEDIKGTTVFYGSEEPDEAHTGDLWLQTPDNITYRRSPNLAYVSTPNDQWSDAFDRPDINIIDEEDTRWLVTPIGSQTIDDTTLKIIDQELVRTNSDATNMLMVAEANRDISVRVSAVNDVNGEPVAGVVVRYVDTNDFWAVTLFNHSATIRHFVNGSATSTTNLPVSIAYDDSSETYFRVDVNDTSLDLWVNGTDIGNVIVTDIIGASKVGIIALDNNGPVIRSIRVTGDPMNSFWEETRDQGISQAVIDAANAKIIAEAKSRVFSQPDEPTGMLPEDDGDLWVDTNNGNRLYTWDGDSWEPRLLGNGSIQPQSLIASDVIATGTVSAALLESIMVLASTIIAGTPGGARIELTPTHLRKYDASNNIEVDMPENGDATFSGIIVASQFIGGQIATALSGERVVIGPNDPGSGGSQPLGGKIEFYSGLASETSPADMTATTRIESGHTSAVLSMTSPSVSAGPTSNISLISGTDAGDGSFIYVESDFIRIASGLQDSSANQQHTPGFTVGPGGSVVPSMIFPQTWFGRSELNEGSAITYTIPAEYVLVAETYGQYALFFDPTSEYYKFTASTEKPVFIWKSYENELVRFDGTTAVVVVPNDFHTLEQDYSRVNYATNPRPLSLRGWDGLANASFWTTTLVLTEGPNGLPGYMQCKKTVAGTNYNVGAANIYVEAPRKTFSYGDTIDINFWVRSSRAIPSALVRIESNPDNIIQQTTAIDANTWTKISITHQLVGDPYEPTGVSLDDDFERFIISIYPLGGIAVTGDTFFQLNDTVDIANVLVEKNNSATNKPYFDGDSSSAVWLGEIGLSSSGIKKVQFSDSYRNAQRTIYSQPITRINLITNPSFETNTTSWTLSGLSTGTGTITRVSGSGSFGEPWLGAYCGRVSLNLSGVSSATPVLECASMPITANKTYTASAYMKNYGVNTSIRISFYQNTTHLVTIGRGLPIEFVDPKSSYLNERMWVTATAPATATHARVSISFGFLATSYSFDVDGFLLEETDELKPYFDGSLVRIDGGARAWTGTSHGSSSVLIPKTSTDIPTDIPANVNLNQFNRVGLFSQSTAANATLALNYPVASVAGILEVTPNWNSTHINQRYTTTTNIVWTRTFNGTSWTVWAPIGDVSNAKIDVVQYLHANFGAYSAGSFRAPSMRLSHNGKKIDLDGLIMRTNTGLAVTGGTLYPFATLPESVRPEASLFGYVFGSIVAAGGFRLQVDSAGVLSVLANTTGTWPATSGGYLSLTGFGWWID